MSVLKKSFYHHFNSIQLSYKICNQPKPAKTCQKLPEQAKTTHHQAKLPQNNLCYPLSNIPQNNKHKKRAKQCHKRAKQFLST